VLNRESFPLQATERKLWYSMYYQKPFVSLLSCMEFRHATVLHFSLSLFNAHTYLPSLPLFLPHSNAHTNRLRERERERERERLISLFLCSSLSLSFAVMSCRRLASEESLPFTRPQFCPSLPLPFFVLFLFYHNLVTLRPM